MNAINPTMLLDYIQSLKAHGRISSIRSRFAGQDGENRTGRSAKRWPLARVLVACSTWVHCEFACPDGTINVANARPGFNRADQK